MFYIAEDEDLNFNAYNIYELWHSNKVVYTTNWGNVSDFLNTFATKKVDVPLQIVSVKNIFKIYFNFFNNIFIQK